MARFKSVDKFVGGCEVGSITCSYDDLVKAFGPPKFSDNYKTSSEWCIYDEESGELFAIYDWKQTNLYDLDAPSVEQFRAMPSYSWHLGGHDKPDIRALAQFIKDCARQ